MDFCINDFLKDLEFLINTDSHSDDIDGNLKILKFFENRLKSAGLSTTLTFCGNAHRPALVAEYLPPKHSCSHSDSSDGHLPQRILMCGHVDTVFPYGTASKRPFTICEDKAYGPGTVDMKASALLMLYLSEYMVKNIKNLPFRLFYNSDEEIGSPDTVDFMLESAKDCDAVFVFEGARKKGQFVNRRKGIAKYKIEITGRASHSGTAHSEGVSAIVELANWIIALDKLNDYKSGLTLNVGTVSGGSALNIVAPHAEAMLEVRYVNSEDYMKADSFIRSASASPFTAGASADITQLSHYPPLNITPKTSKLMKQLEPLELTYVSAGGVSDANRLACLNLPIIDGCGTSGGFPHSEKEFLSIPSVNQRFETMLRIFELLAYDKA